jgi:hypothetical protein
LFEHNQPILFHPDSSLSTVSTETDLLEAIGAVVRLVSNKVFSLKQINQIPAPSELLLTEWTELAIELMMIYTLLIAQNVQVSLNVVQNGGSVSATTNAGPPASPRAVGQNLPSTPIHGMSVARFASTPVPSTPSAVRSALADEGPEEITLNQPALTRSHHYSRHGDSSFSIENESEKDNRQDHVNRASVPDTLIEIYRFCSLVRDRETIASRLADTLATMGCLTRIIRNSLHHSLLSIHSLHDPGGVRVLFDALHWPVHSNNESDAHDSFLTEAALTAGGAPNLWELEFELQQSVVLALAEAVSRDKMIGVNLLDREITHWRLKETLWWTHTRFRTPFPTISAQYFKIGITPESHDLLPLNGISTCVHVVNGRMSQAASPVIWRESQALQVPRRLQIFKQNPKLHGIFKALFKLCGSALNKGRVDHMDSSESETNTNIVCNIIHLIKLLFSNDIRENTVCSSSQERLQHLSCELQYHIVQFTFSVIHANMTALPLFRRHRVWHTLLSPAYFHVPDFVREQFGEDTHSLSILIAQVGDLQDMVLRVIEHVATVEDGSNNDEIQVLVENLFAYTTFLYGQFDVFGAAEREFRELLVPDSETSTPILSTTPSAALETDQPILLIDQFNPGLIDPNVIISKIVATLDRILRYLRTQIGGNEHFEEIFVMCFKLIVQCSVYFVFICLYLFQTMRR